MTFRTFRATALGVLALGAVAVGAGPALAVPCPPPGTECYGNFSGDNYDFIDVKENSETDPVPLFGAPSVLGDTLEFDPVGFGSSSSGDPGSDITDSQLQLLIMSQEGVAIDFIDLFETGDYTLVGPPGTFATAQVAAAVFFRVTEINGVAMDGPDGSANLVFSPSGGTYELPGDAGSAIIWTGQLTVDIAQLLEDNGIIGGATKVELTLDNTLSTANGQGGSAFIKKKEVDGISVTPRPIIPEPGSAVLLGGALAGLSLIRRRRGR